MSRGQMQREKREYTSSLSAGSSPIYAKKEMTVIDGHFLFGQSVKEHSVKLSRNSKIYAAVEKTGKNAVKSRAVPAPCC